MVKKQRRDKIDGNQKRKHNQYRWRILKPIDHRKGTDGPQTIKEKPNNTAGAHQTTPPLIVGNFLHSGNHGPPLITSLKREENKPTQYQDKQENQKIGFTF